MKKPDSLKRHMINAVTELQRDPDRMLIFTDKGNVRCTLANGLSFEYVYDLNFILTEYAGDLDAVMIPLLDWVRVNQHELLANLDKSKEAFNFETVILDNNTVDLSMTLSITERVIVKRQEDGTLNISFPDEEQYERATAPQPFKMIDQKTGNILAEWMSSEPEEQYF
ncbi:phage tail protein [Acinetobacter towneri]|uniref:phage tail protein n=1 Tax=Acinetobacter towneri TaxID=202956 RepID=UPI001CE0504F|nr:phage tail protein [Acinetobacter towneri]MCA4779746.1 phage tail protein [Acinetobacter towneri]MCA4784907.1 phage tail protein [Acinetobacter towneri]MCA4788085.1 phage tail protein [Acinetobacter towneri]MCA4796059.1 phage tail protein [Acinetobacter towneri]MCA4801270.1 phage tail protein [Acinetobacter towneri]